MKLQRSSRMTQISATSHFSTHGDNHLLIKERKKKKKKKMPRSCQSDKQLVYPKSAVQTVSLKKGWQVWLGKWLLWSTEDLSKSSFRTFKSKSQECGWPQALGDIIGSSLSLWLFWEAFPKEKLVEKKHCLLKVATLCTLMVSILVKLPFFILRKETNIPYIFWWEYQDQLAYSKSDLLEFRTELQHPPPGSPG